jgi:hypothetical protein
MTFGFDPNGPIPGNSTPHPPSILFDVNTAQRVQFELVEHPCIADIPKLLTSCAEEIHLLPSMDPGHHDFVERQDRILPWNPWITHPEATMPSRYRPGQQGATTYWLRYYKIGEQTNWWPFSKNKFEIPKLSPGVLVCCGVTWFYPQAEKDKKYQSRFAFKPDALNAQRSLLYHYKAFELLEKFRQRLRTV